MYAAHTIRFPFLTTARAESGNESLRTRRSRDFGVGYGESCGYVKRPSYVRDSGFNFFRVR